MLLIDNPTVEKVLAMEDCIRIQEEAFLGLPTGASDAHVVGMIGSGGMARSYLQDRQQPAGHPGGVAGARDARD